MPQRIGWAHDAGLSRGVDGSRWEWRWLPVTTVAKNEAKTKTEKKGGEMLPVRATLGAVRPRWMERFEDLFSDIWPPLWPMLRFPEDLAFKVPPVDVYEEGGSIVVKAELPGVKKEEIEVHLTDGALTISGKKEKEEKVERKDYRRVERAAGVFSRTITLPAEVELEKVTASFKDGVLEIRAPKVEGAEPKGRKIEVS
jgi:HSP20 family protein